MKTLIASTIILFFASPFANANYHKNYRNARVVDVSPVYEYVTITHSSQPSCPTTNHSQPHNATLIGSVVGGSIGHATSDRKHKMIGSITGAIIGGVIGHKIDNHSATYSQNDCDNRPHIQTTSKQRIFKGYAVSYIVKNKIQQTFSKNKPNKYIRIYH